MLSRMKTFGPTEGTQLVGMLHDSPYGEVHTLRINSHIEAAMHTTGRKHAKTEGQHTSKQYLKHWWHYLTAGDWAILRDPKASFNSKMTRMVERGLSVGCLDADEQTIKWALATLLLTHYDDLPTPQQIYQKVQDFKMSWMAEKLVYKHEQLAEFPENVSDLPEHIFNDAYTDGSPPITIVINGINTVADSIPLRSNSKLLKTPKINRYCTCRCS